MTVIAPTSLKFQPFAVIGTFYFFAESSVRPLLALIDPYLDVVQIHFLFAVQGRRRQKTDASVRRDVSTDVITCQLRVGIAETVSGPFNQGCRSRRWKYFVCGSRSMNPSWRYSHCLLPDCCCSESVHRFRNGIFGYDHEMKVPASKFRP